MSDDGSDLGRIAEFVVTLAFYETVGLSVYLGLFHTTALLSLLETGTVRSAVGSVPGVVLARPDVQVLALGLALFVGLSAFVSESAPGVPDLFGPDAPSGLAYPFSVLQVTLGIVLGSTIGTAFGAGIYLAVVRPDTLPVVADPTGPGAVLGAALGVVAANPDALVGALVGGAFGFWSGYTGRIWRIMAGSRGPDGFSDGNGGGGDGGGGDGE